VSTFDALLKAYERFARMPWDPSVAGPQRVWMVVYPPEQERRLRMRIGDFELATLNAGHGWHLVDITDSFGHWLGAHEYREAYFEQPEDITPALDDFAEYLADEVRAHLKDDGVDEDTVVAIIGVGSLFGLARASRLIDAVNNDTRGRLVVFFPGELEGTNYRLLGARDGWNYLAVPITATEG
jgi:hypothetical protein